MRVLDVREMFIGRGSQEDQNSNKVTRVFQVDTDSMEDDSLVVVADSRIPKMGDEHPSDSSLWVVGVTPSQGNDPVTWDVKVEYDLKPPAATGNGSEAKPWDMEPIISFGFMMRERVLEKAYDIGVDVRGSPSLKVTNSLGQPFDPPAMLDEALLVISIQRNVQDGTFNPVDVATYINTINSDLIDVAGISFAPQCLLCRDYRATPMWTNKNEKYWQEQIEVVYDPHTWIKKIVDQGMFTGEMDSAGYNVKFTPIKDEDGHQVMEPVLLDGLMGRLALGAEPVYLEFHAYWEEAWTGWLPEDA